MSSSTIEDQITKIVGRLDDLETRMSTLENIMLQRKTTPPTGSFKGLSGAINKLIKDNFFETPQTLSQILNEMRRHGYYYSAPAVNTAITRDFMKRKELLTRLGKRGEWKYVTKK